MTTYVDVGGIDDLADGAGRRVVVDDTAIALFKLDRTVHAMADACVIDGTSIAGGIVRGNVVTCTRHAGQYDVTTGRMVGVPGVRLERFPVRVIAGRILVDVEG